MKQIELRPCPFCGKTPTILICDEEGNIHDKDYEREPWSGLYYALRHEIWDGIDPNKACPIATHAAEILGSQLYESVEELASRWNARITGRKYDDGTDIKENDVIHIPEMAHGLKVRFSNKHQAFVCEDISNGLVYELNTFNNMRIRRKEDE